MEPILSKHVEKRMQQRGLSKIDIDFVMRYGTSVKREGVLLCKKDVNREIAARKADIQRLERLSGVKIVVDDGTVITALHASSKHQKWITRY